MRFRGSQVSFRAACSVFALSLSKSQKLKGPNASSSHLGSDGLAGAARAIGLVLTKLKTARKQLRFCALCAPWLILGGSGREEATGTRRPGRRTWCRNLPCGAFVRAAELTFVTVELIAVKNPGNICVLAIKTCGKAKETVRLSNTVGTLRVQGSASLAAGGGRCCTPAVVFASPFGHLGIPVLLRPWKGPFFFHWASYLGSSVTVIGIILGLHEVSQTPPQRSKFWFQHLVIHEKRI